MKASHNWNILGLDETHSSIEINSMDYVVDKKHAVLIHAIMCLVDSVEEVGEQIRDLRIAIEEK